MSYVPAKVIEVSEIPVIDVGALRETDRAAVGTVAQALRRASNSVGFFYIRNHGVPEPMIRRADRAARTFFALPEARKRDVEVNRHHHGYLRIGEAKMADNVKPDLKESFVWGLELPEGRVFDYVVVADVIEHLRNRAQLLRSARRYLKPEGRLIISTPNIALWFYRLSLLAGRFEYGPRGVLDRTHVHLYTRDSFRREVQGAGFHILRERVTALPFEVVFESTGRSRLMRSAARAYHGLARLWPEMFAYQHILEAEIRILDEEAAAPGKGVPEIP